MVVRRICKPVLAFSLLSFLLPALGSYEAEAKKLAELMNWKPGQTIAEIGSGEGQMSIFAAGQVGPAGRVYTTELDDKKLGHLKEEVEKRSLQNVTVLKADSVNTNLPDNCCDSLFMRRVYHHFTDPAATDRALLRALKPGGLLAVIDFAPRAGLPSIENAPRSHGVGHGIAKETLMTELTSAGFEIAAQPKSWPDGDYCVIARKPAAPQQP